MRGMQRHARWIALAVVVAMASPFLAQVLSALFSVDPAYLTVALLLATALFVLRLAWPRQDEEER